jgi:hypothetical protein
LVHARRVKTFEPFSSSQPLRVGYQEYRAFLNSVGPRVLLPNLKELRWHPEDDAIFPFIQLFLAPNIINFRIGLIGSPLIRISFLTTLSIRYPYLTHLELDYSLRSFGKDAERYKEVISAAICSWHNLKCLSVRALSSNGIRHAATLPSLQKLSFFDVKNTHPPGLPLSEGSPAFQALTHLEVYCDRLTFCSGIVKTMSDGILREVDVEFIAPASSSEWMEFLKALNEHCSHASLLKISAANYEFHDIRGDQIPEFTIRTMHLKSLLSFHCLTDVYLRPSGSIDIDDADVQSMAMAWPKIQRLHLGGEPLGHPCVTLSGLTPFAEHCKALRNLTISVDATIIPILKPGPKTSSGSLIEFHAFHSPIAQPEQVAAFLSDLFPNLSYIDNFEMHYGFDEHMIFEDEDKMWEEVDELVVALEG